MNTNKNIYLVSKGGDKYSVYGPYTLAKAMAERGKIFSVVEDVGGGGSIGQGSTIFRAAFDTLVNIGSIRVVG